MYVLFGRIRMYRTRGIWSELYDTCNAFNVLAACYLMKIVQYQKEKQKMYTGYYGGRNLKNCKL